MVEEREDGEDGETVCDDSLLGELSTINSSFSLSVDSNQIQPHQGYNFLNHLSEVKLMNFKK